MWLLFINGFSEKSAGIVPIDDNSRQDKVGITMKNFKQTSDTSHQGRN
jgi:hypothetical protein